MLFCSICFNELDFIMTDYDHAFMKLYELTYYRQPIITYVCRSLSHEILK